MPCQWPEGVGLEHAAIWESRNFSILSILAYPHDVIYHFWSYLWLWTMKETRVHHLS